MKKFKKSKSNTIEKKRGWIFALTTLLLLLVVGIVTLIVCWIYYKWEWTTIAYWLNPFSEGNSVTWVVYLAIFLILFALIWVIHMARVNKNKED